jgi:hypothetical protein
MFVFFTGGQMLPEIKRYALHPGLSFPSNANAMQESSQPRRRGKSTWLWPTKVDTSNHDRRKNRKAKTNRGIMTDGLVIHAESGRLVQAEKQPALGRTI